jgi:hypothetical protein
MEMATHEQIREFLRREYKHERFEGRDSTWPKDEGRTYSQAIVVAYHDDLALCGRALISRHESVRGLTVTFDADLNILSAD